MLPVSDACERNKEPILAVLRVCLAGRTQVLEIGSGTGQHAVHFARHLSHLAWHPTEQLSYLPDLAARVRVEGGANLRPPTVLDVRQAVWPAALRRCGVHRQHAAYHVVDRGRRVVPGGRRKSWWPAECCASMVHFVTTENIRPTATANSTPCCGNVIRFPASATSRLSANSLLPTACRWSRTTICLPTTGCWCFKRSPARNIKERGSCHAARAPPPSVPAVPCERPAQTPINSERLRSRC